jgi:predicted dehydrogenase
MSVYRAGLLGCGDFTRIQTPGLLRSERVKVTRAYDPNPEAAKVVSDRLGAAVADSAEAILEDPAIDIALIFTPPFTRRALVEKAVAAGKRIITTKPLASTLEDARAISDATRDGRCLVIYKRTGDAGIQSLKKILVSRELGDLALYRHDWVHHYPYWAPWALDPKKNGGPLIDALIHNLNTARHLADREVVGFGYHGYRLTQQFAIPDTELLILDFEGGATAQLFITWAADLAIYDRKANDRERININYVVTSERYLLRFETRDARPMISATRDGHVRLYPVEAHALTIYDRYVDDIEAERPLETSAQEAYRDLELALYATAHPTGGAVPTAALTGP